MACRYAEHELVEIIVFYDVGIMATVQEFIQSKLSRFGILLTDTELTILLADNDLVGTDLYSSDKRIVLLTAVAGVIPELLLKPDITEGGYSEKWNRDGIMAYYSMLCKELGIDDLLNPGPTLENISDRW